MTDVHAALMLTAAFALGLGGCSPLANRIDVGEEPFLVFVANGEDNRVDLFATQAGGGSATRLTFTPMVESHPALSPRGDMLAFLRGPDSLPETPRDLVVMNLLNGAERVLPLAVEAGSPERVGWGDDHTELFVRTTTGVWRVAAPPAAPEVAWMEGSAREAADQALDVWLGTPRFARAFNCAGGGACLVGPSGDTTVLAERGRDPFRWGGDSVGWFEGDELYVRGLGPAVARPVRLGSRAPTRPRQGTYGEQRTEN